MANRLLTPEEASQDMLEVINTAANTLPEEERAEFVKAAVEWLWGASSNMGLDGKRRS